ncbi:hypothetical protein ABZY68_08070 [Streptomyces sp. NPDC006482]|uniref:hypothetical protein n=1 Tax=unclassified Streptomyces TaxID=2593676 RepID=UPI00225AEF96|nr:hypothetical protein [Streptomyces sp. NBC_00094]MCX5390548.1 hypothetical protein [Streptomyces sp. NBC_00094]
MADGGLVLRATDDFRDYTPDRIAMVHGKLQKVLFSGEPVGRLSEMTPRLVFESPEAR